MSGIYKITCGSTFYYGQAQDLRVRKNGHISKLRKGQHRNRHLQRAYDKYEDFTFEVVLVCETNELDRYEQWFLDTYQPLEKCANMATEAETTWRGLRHSEETKAKISKAHRGKKRPAISAAMRGRTVPQETRTKIAATLRGRERGEVCAKSGATRTAGHRYVVERESGVTEYRTVAEAAEAIGVNQATFYRWSKGTKPAAKHAILSVRRRTL